MFMAGLDSKRISSSISTKIPCPVHFDWSKQSTLFNGTPVPNSLSFVHSTIFLYPVLFRRVDIKSAFCWNLALIPGEQMFFATSSNLFLSNPFMNLEFFFAI